MTAPPPGRRTSPQRVAAAIPAFQAAPFVGSVVRGTLAVLSDVVVVDDGSDDETGERAREAGAEVVRIEPNLGKGNALRAAFGRLFGAGFDAVVTLDADGQHLPSEIPTLLAEYAAGADLVLGTRDHLFAQMSRVRSASNRLSSRAISFAAGMRLSDIQTGFRVYSRRLFESVPFVGARFEAESAIVVRAARRGLIIRPVPVRMGTPDGRATSHYRPLVDSFRIAGAVIRARLG
jgi:glycosyltransferase involved in cell wall biosynthesis